MIGPQKYSGRDIKTILAEKGLNGNAQHWQKLLERVSGSDVERALSQPIGSYSLEKLLAFVSLAAEDYLEDMAQLAHQLTIQRFGRTIRLYAPVYLSNFCINSCRYCGFNKASVSERKRLTIEQAIGEADIIASEGFRDILLVSSEDRKFITIEYLAELARKLRPKFSSISIEIYPMSSTEYAKLFAAGIDGVTLYQETYNRQAYQYYHSAGPKSDYDNRLNTPNRIASAGMREIGLGVLLGLADWRIETLALGEHAHYLMKRYWQSHISFSFPRLRPAQAVNDLQFEHLLSDKSLVQMILALRLCFADVGLVLSTRERAELRDRLIKLGITKISAGSKTNPGGYSDLTGAVEQFEVDDRRNPAQVAAMIREQGFETVWKDWDSSISGKKLT
ncbi:MAG: 2-iminoacetate synthase ThiH [Sedimentisphaerales bacterium]